MVFEKQVGMTICLHFEANRNKNLKSRNQNRLQARIKSRSVIINFSFFIWSNAGSLYDSWVIQHCSFRERVPMIKMDQIIPQISIRLGKVSYLTSLIGRHTFECNTWKKWCSQMCDAGILESANGYFIGYFTLKHQINENWIWNKSAFNLVN